MDLVLWASTNSFHFLKIFLPLKQKKKTHDFSNSINLPLRLTFRSQRSRFVFTFESFVLLIAIPQKKKHEEEARHTFPCCKFFFLFSRFISSGLIDWCVAPKFRNLIIYAIGNQRSAGFLKKNRTLMIGFFFI